MHKRLYLLFHDPEQISNLVNELLIHRVDIHHIHGIAKNPTLLGDIPEATQFQKKDISRSLLLGSAVGAIGGIIVGIIAHNVLNMEYSGILIVTAIFGALFGAWSASMVGMMTPNTEVAQFEKAINEGAVLLIVDVTGEKHLEVVQTIKQKFPNLGDNLVESESLGFP